MSDALVEAIDAARENRPSDLYDMVGWMLVRKGLKGESLDEVRAEVCVGIAKLIGKTALSIDIAKQIPTIVRRRISDYFPGSDDEPEHAVPEIISLDAAVGYEPSSSDDIAAFVVEQVAPGVAQVSLLALKDSQSKHDRRDYWILEAHVAGKLDKTRIEEIVGKEVSNTYMGTLLHRAKQRLKGMYESAGGRRIGA